MYICIYIYIYIYTCIVLMQGRIDGSELARRDVPVPPRPEPSPEQLRYSLQDLVWGLEFRA